MTQNWRTEVDALDYLGHQRKQLQVADRRPVIRKASDLVGPGIGSMAVQITDFNDSLALHNGYYTSAAGATGAPNAVDAFVGTVVADETRGILQTFTGLTTGIRYTRMLKRHPIDPTYIVPGSVWLPQYRAQTGRESTTAITAGTTWNTITGTITFAVPFVGSVPEVFLQNRTAYTGADPVLLEPVSVTLTGFAIQGRCATAKGAQSVSWRAEPATQ